MRHILIVWRDRDGSDTVHEFDSPAQAEPWLRSVLDEHCPTDELEAKGYADDGIGMLNLYSDEGYDDVGSLEVFIDGVGVGPDALYQ